MGNIILLQANSLIPNDFALPIPGNIGFFQFLIVFSFLLHILFVNITISGAVFAVFNEIKGIVTKNKIYDKLALQLATLTSIFKSIAVVLGIAPLLLISVIYTQFFYPSTILIGKAWLSLIILLTVAFLSLYVYKFTWVRFERKKAIHLFFGLVGTIILLFVPLIFIVSVVSMLYPEMWAGANGFFHSLFYYPQIWQRYTHFMLSSFAVMGVFMYLWNRRLLTKLQTNVGEENDGVKEVAATIEQSSSHEAVYQAGKKFGIGIAFWTTVLQFVSGSLVLVSLEKEKMMLYMGENAFLTGLLMSSILVSIILTFSLYMVIKTDAKRWFNLSIATFILVIALMGWMRHEVREVYIKPHQELNPQTVLADKESHLGDRLHFLN